MNKILIILNVLTGLIILLILTLITLFLMKDIVITNDAILIWIVIFGVVSSGALVYLINEYADRKVAKKGLRIKKEKNEIK